MGQDMIVWEGSHTSVVVGGTNLGAQAHSICLVYTNLIVDGKCEW